MKDYLALIVAIVAGIFAVASTVITWQLKKSTDEKLRLLALDKERHDELRDLYTETITLIAKSITSVRAGKPSDVVSEFHGTNAKIQLLASKQVVSHFEEFAGLLEKWSHLYAKATPEPGIIRSPDPTAKFKKPAEDAYEEMDTAIRKMLKLMRRELTAQSMTLRSLQAPRQSSISKLTRDR